MVNYQDQLCLNWCPGKLDAEERLRVETSSRYVLEAIAAIEEHHPDRFAEEQPELHQELSRIDAKLHLVLELVTQLRKERHDVEAPPRRKVVFSAERIKFESPAQDVDPGSEGVLKVFLHPAIPEPLSLPGRIRDVAEHDDAVIATLEPFGDQWGFREALSRHVFRHHRRQVAASRAGER